MNAKPECIVCAFRQALNTARVATDDPETHRRILAALAANPCCFNLDQPPTRLSQPVYQTVSQLTGLPDPFLTHKAEINQTALHMAPDLRACITRSEDPLDTALHIAVAGNIIDMGIGHEFDLKRDIIALTRTPFAVSAIEPFKRELQPGRRLLYLGDNAGEIVFDKLLIEHLLTYGVHITFVVKSAPIINDATMKDARDVGITGLVPVIETGTDDIGVNWDAASPAFRKAVDEADFIVAKGHGNFETCDNRPENFYFLLKAKCPVVAGELGVRLGDIVFASRGSLNLLATGIARS